VLRFPLWQQAVQVALLALPRRLLVSSCPSGRADAALDVPDAAVVGALLWPRFRAAAGPQRPTVRARR
jgi:hypothetical protein